MEPLLIHHHIQKTAGSSLRQVAQANFRASEVVTSDRVVEQIMRASPTVRERGLEWSEAKRAFRDYYDSLSPERRAGIRCFVGHLTPFLISAVTDRPVRAFCMLRDPVERIISFYRYGEQPQGTRGASGREMLGWKAMRERGWELKDVYRNLGGAPDASSARPFVQLFNGQTRHILMGVLDPAEIPLSSGQEGLDGYRERVFGRLADMYVVGTQERFSQSVRLFADSFGWQRVFVPRVRVTSSDPQAVAVDDETRSLIREHNQLDAAIHAHYSERLRSLPPVGRVAHLRGKAYFRSRQAARSMRERRERLLGSRRT